MNGISVDSGTVGPSVALLVFSDALVFAGSHKRRQELDGAIALAQTGELSAKDVGTRLPGALMLPLEDVTAAVLTRSFRGAAYGTSKLWFQGAEGKTWSTWLVTRKAREPLQDLLRAALGDRFENRREKPT